MAGNYVQLLDIINNPTQHGLPAWDNNAKQIEGETIQQYLLSIISSLTVGYQFMGVATPSTSPGTPDQNVFYFAGPGTYPNFGNTEVPGGSVGIFTYNGNWSYVVKEITGLQNELLNGYDQKALTGEQGRAILSLIGQAAGILHFYPRFINPREYHDVVNYYTICRIENDCHINSVIGEYANNLSAGYAKIAIVSADGSNIVFQKTLNPGQGYGQQVETILDFDVTAGMYVCMNAFYFDTSTQENQDDSWIIGISSGSVISFQTGSKRFVMAASLDISSTRQVAENANNQIAGISTELNTLKNVVGGPFPIYDSLDIAAQEYIGSDGYTICTVQPGTLIKSIKMCGSNGTSPTMELAKLENGFLYKKASFLLYQCGGDNVFVETPIGYTCDEELYVILRGTFYFQVLPTSSNVPYIVSNTVDETGKYLVQNPGTRDLAYKLQIVSVDVETETIYGDVEELKNQEKIALKIPYSDLSMVETMGCCGDSYTAGMIAVEPPYYPTSETFERKNLSWGKILERHYGISVSVYAKGAMTVKTYLTDSACLPLLLSEPAKKLYAISLGHNDAVMSTTVGSISSLVGPWEDYPDDFIGNYGRLIEQIQEHAPNAYIILLRQSRPYALVNNGAALNQAISDLGEHYGLPVFDPEDDPYLSSDVWLNTMIRRHPVFPGYAGMAMAFARMFAKATVTYWEYFRLFGIN